MNIPQLDTETRDALIEVLKKPSDDVPTADELKEVFGEGTDALTAKWRLRFRGYAGRHIELAMQRARDNGILELTLEGWKYKAA